MKTPFSIATAALLLVGSIPAAMALTFIDDQSGLSVTTSGTSQWSASSQNSSWTSSENSNWSALAQRVVSCTNNNVTGNALTQCLMNAQLFQTTAPSWMSANTNPWMQNMPSLHCNLASGTERVACEQQLINEWQISYRSYRNWVDSMDTSMQEMMQGAGLSEVQVQNIWNGNVSSPDTTGMSAAVAAREAWKICQKFEGRTQARCMRDALTEDRLQEWADLDNVLNNGR